MKIYLILGLCAIGVNLTAANHLTDIEYDKYETTGLWQSVNKTSENAVCSMVLSIAENSNRAFNKIKKIKSLLQNSPEQINEINVDGNTALHLATLIADTDVAKNVIILLLRNGASRDIRNNMGERPWEYNKLSDDTIDGLLRPIDTQLQLKHQFDDTRPNGGSRNSNQDLLYQHKLSMVLVKHGVKKDKSFYIATDVPEAGLFDDIVCKFEKKKMTRVVAYKVIYKQDENTVITEQDLLTSKTRGDFGLQKYFNSYLKMPNYSELVIATNIDLDENLKHSLEIVDRKFIDTKITTLYKFKNVIESTIRLELEKELRKESDYARLIATLYDHIANEKIMTLNNDLFKKYRIGLFKAKIIDPFSETRLHTEFMNNSKNLSVDARQFREDFERYHKEIDPKTNIWMKLNDLYETESGNRYSNLIGLQCVLDDDLEISISKGDIESGFDELTSRFRDVINNAKRKTIDLRSKQLQMIDDSLAGHVIVAEKKGTKTVHKFSSRFLYSSDTSLPPNVLKFRKRLRNKLNDIRKSQIRFKDLSEYTILIGNDFPTCEDGQQNANQLLPKIDDVASDKINDFFTKLTFAVNLPNEKQLTEIIIHKSRISRDKFKMINKKHAHNQFLAGISDWFENNEGKIVTEESATQMFNVMTDDYLLPILHDVVELNEHFVGRTTELQQLIDNQNQMSVITGLGGMGKTQLAAKLAEYYAQNQSNVVWIDAESPVAIERSFIDLARSFRLSIPTHDSLGNKRDVQNIIQDIYHFLSDSKTLYIFDNVDRLLSITNNEYELSEYLPLNLPNEICKLIRIETIPTHPRWIDSRIELEGLKFYEAKQFVNKSLSSMGVEDDNNVLAINLFKNPLALQHAVTYIKNQLTNEDKHNSTLKYMDKLNHVLMDMYTSEDSKNFDKIKVYGTLNVTLDEIKMLAIGHQAIKIFIKMAYLRAENIPKELFTSVDALKILRNYSLIDEKDGKLSIQPSVQDVIRTLAIQNEQKMEVFRDVIKLFPDVDKMPSKHIDHFISAWSHVNELENATIGMELTDQPEKLINRLISDGRHSDAIYFGQTIIPYFKKIFGENDKFILNIELMTAKAQLRNGEYSSAITICDSILGRDRKNNITDVSPNTYFVKALALKYISEFSQARNTLEIANRFSAEDQALRVQILYELAQSHSVDNQNDLAMEYFEQITQIPRENIKLPKIEKINIIADSYAQIDENDQAIKLYKKAQKIDDLSIQKECTIEIKIAAILGKKEKSIAINKYNTLFKSMEKFIEKSHPMLMNVELRMAKLRDELGDVYEAVKIYRRNRERRGGKNRPYNRIIDAINTRIKELEKNMQHFTLSNALRCLSNTEMSDCLFSRTDIQQFTIGEIDINHPENLTIDIQKCLEFIRAKNDAKMNAQIFELLKINHQLITNIYDANVIMLKDTIYGGGLEELTKAQRLTETALLTYYLRNSLEKDELTWKSKSLKSMNKIIIYDSFQSAKESCADVFISDNVFPCVTGIGAAVWVIISNPVADSFVKYSSNVLAKFLPKKADGIEYAIGFALNHVSHRIAPAGTHTGVLSNLVNISGGKTRTAFAGSKIGIVSDGIELTYSASVLGNCLYNANTNGKCSYKYIRDNIASIVFSSVSFIAGILSFIVDVPIVGIFDDFGIVVTSNALSFHNLINTQIENIDSQIHTNYDEDSTFAYLFKSSRDTYTIEDIPLLSTMRYIKSMFDGGSKSNQSEEVKRGAEFAWKSLQEQPSNVVAYGVGLRPHAIIRLNETSKSHTKIGSIIPIGSTSIEEHFKPICVPHDRKPIGLFDEVEIPSAVYYCENALVISDKRSKEGNTVILNLGSIETGEIIGSNKYINIFLCFQGTYKVIGGKSTTNVFMLFNKNKVKNIPQMVGGVNATNIIDLSQNIQDYYEKAPMEIQFEYTRGHIQINNKTIGIYLNDTFDEKNDNRTYKYVGKSHQDDEVICSMKNETDRILIDSGGGKSDIYDNLYNCNRAFISPFTNVLGDRNHKYQMYVKTTGYNGTDLETNFFITNGYAYIIFLDFELSDKKTVVKYEWESNKLHIMMEFGVKDENLFKVTIHNYLVGHEIKKPIVSLFDKNNRRIVPKILESSFEDEISDNSFLIVDSYEIFAYCSNSCNRLIFDDPQANSKCECSDLLNISEQFNALTTVSVKNAGDLFIGSHQNDLMYINDEVSFARGQSGSDTYIVMDSQNHTSQRTFDILNCAPDNEIDIVYLPNVPTTYLIHQTDLIVHAEGVKVRVHKFMTSTECRHLIFMNANRDTFIVPVPTSEHVSENSIEPFARFLFSTPSQISFILPKNLRSERIVIDALLSELKLYKYNNDLMIIRESHNQLVIQIQQFYLNRSKWENIEWFLHKDGIFQKYYGLELLDDDVADYAEKIKLDYSNDLKDYETNFSESYSISHNHLDYLQDRTGVLLIEDVLPNRISVQKDGNKLVFIDRHSNNKVSIEDWDNPSYRISMLVFNSLKPITIYGLDKYGLDQVDIIQKLIDKATENYELYNKTDELVDLGVQCLIAIDGLNQTIPLYQCNGFNTIEEQFDFVNKYCTNETLDSFRKRLTVRKVDITTQRLLNDVTLKRGIDYTESEYENSYEMCTNQMTRISAFVKSLREVKSENYQAEFGNKFDIVSEFLYWSNHQKLNPNQPYNLNNQLLDYLKKSPNISVNHVRNLVEQGASLETRNSANQTLLHLAALRSDADIIGYLGELLTPATIDAVDEDDATALDYIFEMIQEQYCDVKKQKADEACNIKTINAFNNNDIVHYLRRKGVGLHRVK